MENIKIKRITSNDLTLEEARSIADNYADAFADKEGWDENTRCPTTGVFFGAETSVGQPCACCSLPLEEAYPQGETTAYIFDEISKTGAVAFLGIANEQIIGASWGYTSTPKDLALDKWSSPQMQETVTQTLQNTAGELLFYGSETFINRKARRKGAATGFVKARIDAVSELGLSIVGRTLRNSPMSQIYLRLGFQEIDMIDNENPGRALYIYQNKEE